VKPRLAVSAGLALTAHAAVIWALARAPSAPTGAAQPAPLPARTVVIVLPAATPVQPEPPAPEDTPRQQEAAAPTHATADSPAPGPTPAPDRYAPTLTPEAARIGMPDANVPPTGVVLRVLLHLDAQGAAAATDFAAPPQTPAGFVKTADLALRRGLLQLPPEALAQPGLAYCLRVRFMPDGTEAELAWLPGMAHSRDLCLQGREAEARVLQ
jgi:hypothetical protein